MAAIALDSNSNFLSFGEYDCRCFSATLIEKLGGNTTAMALASFLQQIHYWAGKKGGIDAEDGHYVYKTAKELGSELGKISEWTIYRLSARLRSLGLIIVRRLRKSERNQVNCYRIDYEALNDLLGLQNEDAMPEFDSARTTETLISSRGSASAKINNLPEILEEAETLILSRDSEFTNQEEAETLISSRQRVRKCEAAHSQAVPIYTKTTNTNSPRAEKEVEQMNQFQDNSKDELVEDLEPATKTDSVENSSSGDDRLPRRSTSEIKRLHNAPWYRGNVQERLNPQRLLPQGEWSIEGKLDPNFQEWLAKKWLDWFGDRYKGDLFAAKADVLAYFVNQPEKLPIRWQQYHEEYKYRFKVTKQTIDAGVKIDKEYQQRLGRNSRAVTTPLDEKHNLLYNQSLQAYSDASAPALEGTTEEDIELPRATQAPEFDSGISAVREDATPEFDSGIAPSQKEQLNAPRKAVNPAAYKPFVPTPEPTATTEEIKSWWQDAFSKFKSNISFAKKAAPEIKPEDRENIPVAINPYVDFTGLTPEEKERKLALLNDWLKVPALAIEAVRLAKQTKELEVIVEDEIVVAIDWKF
ncbi:MAG: hypothetical protein ACRDBG_04485 [Waterburya sp.]